MGAGFRYCSYRLNDGDLGAPYMPSFARGHAYVLLFACGGLASPAGVLGRQATVADGVTPSLLWRDVAVSLNSKRRPR